EVGLWSTNAATTWNGGGYHLHASYGYGMVNAFNAVRMAEVWSLFGAAETSANEVLVQSGLNDFADTQVPQITGEFTTTFTIADDVQIDHVALNLSLAALTIGDLVLRLTSADGTTITVANENRFSGGSATTTTWTYGIEGFRGELSAGTWTLTATDAYGGPATTLLSASLDIYGSAPRADDVYHFTDEFLTMLGAQSGRGTITDTNGGQDWLNLAAVTGNVALNLASGQVLTVAGAAWATLAGAFENAVTGDGADTLRGTGVDNALHGMRGDDVISGLGGADRLFGGAGNDIIYGGDGADRISGGAGIDSLYGGAGIDLLNYSGAGSSVVVSLNQGMGFLGDALFDVYSGFERVFGSAFADTLVASDDGTVIRGGGGGDFINGSIGMDRAVYFGSAAGVTVDLSTTLGTGGDAEGDVLIGIEYLTGSAHDDVLIGDAG
ncbi:MAG: proprotein convertase P-domain-containing protein, partial [Fuscovulum sp.]|nr:proprotein convertase P-domain-containing protein [Fuscovulum sp.]